MALIRYRRGDDGLKALDDLHNEIDKLFNFSPLTNWPAASTEDFNFAPALDVWEDKENVYVETDLPGLNQKDISVKVKGEDLIIQGKKEEVKQEKKKLFARKERFSGSFYRAVTLPTLVDAKKVKAKYKNGVLSIALAKKETEVEKEIDIAVE